MKRNGKAYRRLVLSFGLIFLIPIGMSLIFYLYIYHTVSEQTESANRSLLNTVKSACDREFRFYENMLVQLALNRSVQELAAVRGEFGKESAFNLYDLCNELSSMLVSVNKNGDYCRDMFVYFKNSDEIVSSYGCMSFDMYCELYCGDGAQLKAELRQELTEYHFRDVTRIETRWTKENPVLLLTMSALQGKYGDSTAMVGLWLDMGAMNHSVEAVEWENGLDWLILNEDGQVLNRMQEETGPELTYEEVGREGRTTVWEGKEYIAYTAASQDGERRYVLLMSETMISARAGQIRNVFLVGILLCTCLGFAVSAEMMKVNYSPLKKIMELFRTQGGDQEYGDNEYQYLENSAVFFFKEHSDFRQRVEENRRTMRQYYLASLLEAPYDAARDTKSLAAAAPGMETGRNLVLLFHIQEKEETEDSMNSLKYFIVRNVFGEGIGEHFRQETVELGDTVAMILNLEEESGEHTELLMETADGLQRFIRENFGFSVAVLAGEAHEGLAGIHESYLEARKAEEFLDTPDVDFINYREIRNRSRGSYAYTQEQEERIIAALVAHNAALAVSYINKVLDVNLLENRISPDMRRCLLYDLAGTLMKASAETGFPAKNEQGGYKWSGIWKGLPGRKAWKTFEVF